MGSERTSCSPAGAAERRKDAGRRPWDARGGRAGSTPRCFKGSPRQLVGFRRRRNEKLGARLIYPVKALRLRRLLWKEMKDLIDAEGFGEKTWWLSAEKDAAKVGGATREEASPL